MSDRILFVDDDPYILRAMTRALELDFDLMTAGSAYEAIGILEAQGPFKVVVTDINMPGMDGIELTQVIAERWPGTICVILSGNQETETEARVQNLANVFRFLRKPTANQEVAGCLQEILESA